MKKIAIKYIPTKGSVWVVRKLTLQDWADGLSASQEARKILRQERYNEVIRINNE